MLLNNYQPAVECGAIVKCYSAVVECSDISAIILTLLRGFSGLLYARLLL